ncbi:helix-turn-helix domain-containing protein [Rhizobium sp. 'Codium 1']|uniref:helix-turn-helix domain-containing protein n=1 Tax=Rhizobium sp. 'Codium 1' TaxID=2940484 RepID=UPI001E419A9C|nr:helix-turn-helix transcriptional regulator [Rhizobium sp. 'Codium 1']MCC8934247.1 helix-turn-helix transcriptional regulator [Rhizobium sp. 'Codium 1']
MIGASQSLGDFLREWRQRRHLSQLDLALDANISQRHLSFIESGRASPSREMLLRLTERLAIPLRERNPILVAAGFAPIYLQRSLDEPALAVARQTVDLILKGHEPHPALAVDRHWTLVAANGALELLLTAVRDPELLRPPVNVLRLSLHPSGLAPDIVNFGQWRHHLLDRLQQQIAASGDPVLRALRHEFQDLPHPEAQVAGGSSPIGDKADFAVPLQLRTKVGVLSFLSTTTVFGSPVDITLSELAIESFFPADPPTAERLKCLMATKASR